MGIGQQMNSFVNSEQAAFGEGHYGNSPDSGFDEAAYLSANPDVAAAVAAGDYRTGRDHYLMYGANEGRGGVVRAMSPEDRQTTLTQMGSMRPWVSSGAAFDNYLARGLGTQSTPDLNGRPQPWSPSPGFEMGNPQAVFGAPSGDPLPQVSPNVVPTGSGAAPPPATVGGGLIHSIATTPSFQSTQTDRFTPASPSAIQLTSVNPNRTSLPQMNANAVSAISGLPINQSRFQNAGQPNGMMYQVNPNYVSDIDLTRTLTPQDYISRFGVK